jgi:hypothetical protein
MDTIGTSRRTTSLFRGNVFLRFLFPVVPSVSLLTQHVYSFVYFCVIFLIDLFTRFVGFSLGTYNPYKNLSMCLVSYYKYSDLYSLCRTRQLIITNVLFWRTVEMYASIHISVTEKKRVLFSFILFGNILWVFKIHDSSIKFTGSYPFHAYCTSDSPVWEETITDERSRERVYYC